MKSCWLGSYTTNQNVNMKIAVILKFIPLQGTEQDFSGISLRESNHNNLSEVR